MRSRVRIALFAMLFSPLAATPALAQRSIPAASLITHRAAAALDYAKGTLHLHPPGGLPDKRLPLAQVSYYWQRPTVPLQVQRGVTVPCAIDFLPLAPINLLGHSEFDSFGLSRRHLRLGGSISGRLGLLLTNLPDAALGGHPMPNVVATVSMTRYPEVATPYATATIGLPALEDTFLLYLDLAYDRAALVPR